MRRALIQFHVDLDNAPVCSRCKAPVVSTMDDVFLFSTKAGALKLAHLSCHERSKKK